MISYKPFWSTLKAKNMSTYILIKKYQVSASLIDKLRHDKGVNITTIDDLCGILKCNIEDIVEHIEDM